MNVQQQQKGSALLIVVVVLLIISAAGMTLVAVTESGQKSVHTDTHYKDALYVAEIGLRVAEAELRGRDHTLINRTLNHDPSANGSSVHPGKPVVPQNMAQYGVRHLGTYLTAGMTHDVEGTEMVGQEVNLPAPPSGRAVPRAFFTLYVRNNMQDTSVSDGLSGTDAREDNDNIVNLISVGWLAAGDRILAVKILEEEYAWTGNQEAQQFQKLRDSGGTSSYLLGSS